MRAGYCSVNEQDIWCKVCPLYQDMKVVDLRNMFSPYEVKQCAIWADHRAGTRFSSVSVHRLALAKAIMAEMEMEAALAGTTVDDPTI